VTEIGPPSSICRLRIGTTLPRLSKDITKPNTHERSARSLCGILNDQLRDAFRNAHHAGRIDGFVGGDKNKAINTVRLRDINNILGAKNVVRYRLGWIELHQWDVFVCGSVKHYVRPVLGKNLFESFTIPGCRLSPDGSPTRAVCSASSFAIWKMDVSPCPTSTSSEGPKFHDLSAGARSRWTLQHQLREYVHCVLHQLPSSRPVDRSTSQKVLKLNLPELLNPCRATENLKDPRNRLAPYACLARRLHYRSDNLTWRGWHRNNNLRNSGTFGKITEVGQRASTGMP